MDKIVELLTELLPDIDVRAEEHMVDDGILDSFDIICLITELDKEYGIEIPAQEIDSVNFNSAGAIKAMVDRLLAQL